MDAPLVVITDHDFDDFSPEREVLDPHGILLEVAQCRTESEIMDAAKGASGLLVQYAPVSDSVLAALPTCRVVARYGVGVDSVDLAAATRHKVVVCNVRNYCPTEVADHAMSLLLALARRTVMMNEQVRRGIWDVYRDGLAMKRMGGQVLGVIGFGSIGSAVAERARAFGLRVLAYDPYVMPSQVEAGGASPVSLDELLRASDFVSIHAPLTHESNHLIGAGELAMMKPTAFLINTSRGGLVSGEDLARALAEGKLAGAALDVLEKEPPDPSNPLLSMQNVILTPHAAFYSQESQRALHAKAAEGVVAVLSGRIPEFVVNTEVLAQLPELR